MTKSKSTTTKNAVELAEFLGLTPSDAVEIEIRTILNNKIIEIVNKEKLTHSQVASLAGTSRTRITAIMNHNTRNVSTDLMLRILGAIGYTATMKFKRAA